MQYAQSGHTTRLVLVSAAFSACLPSRQPRGSCPAVLQDKCGEMFALLLNRLGANLLPESWRPDTWKGRQASVQLQPGGPEITTPGGLVAALCALPGVDFFMQIVSRVTGFSQGAPRPAPCCPPAQHHENRSGDTPRRCSGHDWPTQCLIAVVPG